MARPILLSNGELHVGLNDFGLVHDFYYPYVGFENHSAGAHTRHKVGVWVDGQLSWLDDGSWNIQMHTAEGALIGHTRAHHKKSGVVLEFDDVVDTDMSVLIRNIHVINDSSSTRDIRLFMHQAFAIGDSRSNTDTAQYLPDSDAILHYRGRRVLIVGGKHVDTSPFDQHAIGLFGIEGHEGTFRDADDGELEGSDVEHGRVDSTLRFAMSIAPYESSRVEYWVAAGTSVREALYIHKSVTERGVTSFIQSSANWWHEWLAPAHKASERIPKEYRRLFLHSALVIKANIDKRGAIIATTDSAMLNYARDAYAYCWPRDGSYALWPLIRLGYKSEPYRFFEFCRRGLHHSGYLMHKYMADGSLGSSWHPYTHGSINAAPIQEDETALTLFMFAQFYNIQQDPKLLTEFYENFVKKMADFISNYVDERTGLPRPTYDLWEETFITSTYTTAVVYGALIAAVDLAEAAQDSDSAVRWQASADDIQRAAQHQLYNQDAGYFLKGLRPTSTGYEPETTIDVASFYGVFMFGLFDLDSPEVKNAFTTLQSQFSLSDTEPGIPRYSGDRYRQQAGSGKSNTWFITTLWLAQYLSEVGNAEAAHKIVRWVSDRADISQMLGEQIQPDTHDVLSVSPLVWSHAETMATLLDIAEDSNE